MSEIDVKISDIQEIESCENATTGNDQRARRPEHELTIAEIWKSQKLVIWWCFYWAMAAVGW